MKDSTLLFRAAAAMADTKKVPWKLVFAVRALGVRLDHQERRDRGQECCEACGTWGTLEKYRSDTEGCYYCPACWGAWMKEIEGAESEATEGR